MQAQSSRKNLSGPSLTTTILLFYQGYQLYPQLSTAQLDPYDANTTFTTGHDPNHLNDRHEVFQHTTLTILDDI